MQPLRGGTGLLWGVFARFVAAQMETAVIECEQEELMLQLHSENENAHNAEVLAEVRGKLPTECIVLRRGRPFALGRVYTMWKGMPRGGCH